MRKYLPDELENVSIRHILQYFYDTEQALILYEDEIVSSAVSRNMPTDNTFFGLSVPEVRERFISDRSELGKTTVLSLIAATEADFRVDYLSRVQARKKDKISKAFRQLFREKRQFAALDKDLLRVWRDSDRELESVTNPFVEALKYRHWLAHGRYWLNRVNKSYTPENVYLICENLLNAVRQRHIFYGGQG